MILRAIHVRFRPGVILVKRKPVKANKLALDALKPEGVKYEVSVAGYPGLVVRVWPSDERTFLYRHRQDGQLRRIALKASTLADAVTEWNEERKAARLGVDIASRRLEERHEKRLKRAEERRDPTVQQLADRYITEYAKRHKRSWAADQRMLTRLVVPDLGPIKAKAVRRADIHALVHKIARKTPTQGNRVLAVVRKLFSFALDAGVIDTHPCLRMKAPAPELVRDRVLTDAELRAIWNADPAILNPILADALRLQLLTACRIGEVVGATKAELDKEATWTVPGTRTKNKLDHVVPLVAEAAAIIKRRRDNGAFLFPWPTRQGHLMPDLVSHELLVALPKLEVPHFGTHDLRRTVATRLSELGIDKETRERVLNHKDRTVMGKHYDKNDGLKQKRDALTAWARQLRSIVSGMESTVIELKSRATPNGKGMR